MVGALLLVLLLIQCFKSSMSVGGQILLCDKPDFPEAYYGAPLGAVKPGTVLLLTCREAYKPGSPKTKCENGQWTAPTPPCQLVECPHDDLVKPHVHVSRDCLGVNCVSNLTCEEGYWYDGPMTKRCQRDGTWSGPIVSCKVVQCSKLSIPSNGWVNQTERGYRAIATVHCDEGYLYSKPGSSTRQCQANNSWSGEEGQCKVIECPQLPALTNGQVLQQSSSYGAKAEMKCNIGYKYSDSSHLLRRCLENATWSGINGTCQAEPCPQLEPVKNGFLSATSGAFTDVVTLQCIHGYVLNGNSSTSCMAGGKWSATLGVCKGQTSSGIQALWILVILVPAAVLGVWYYCRPDNGQNPRANQPGYNSLPKSVLTDEYVQITVKNSFSSRYTDANSRQYAEFKDLIEKQLFAELKKKIHVTSIVVLGFLKPNKISLHITREEPVTQDICTALKQVTFEINQQGTYEFVCESLNIPEQVTNEIKLRILSGKHIPDNGKDFEIDFDSQYVDLRIIRPNTAALSIHKFSREATGEWRDHGEDISVEDIIRREKGLILVLGRAGVGKSTLMQNIARKWANGLMCTHLKAIFFLNLRFLMCDQKKMTFSSLVSVLPTYINVNNMVRVDDEWLKTNQALIAVMLDGLDEIGQLKEFLQSNRHSSIEDTPLGWCIRLLKRQYLPCLTLLFSTRSPEDVRSLINPDDAVEVMGIPDSKITGFIAKHVKDETKRQKAEQALMRNPILRSISTITFYCAALCHLLQEDESLAEELVTYTRIIACLLEMYIDRSLKSGLQQRAVISDYMKSCLQSLSHLAYHGLTGSKPNFKQNYRSDELIAAGIDAGKRATLQKAGLLLWSEDSQNPDSGLGQFVHLSIQEYMAMASLLTLGLDELKRVLGELSSASRQFNMALIYLVGLAFNRRENAVSRTSCTIGMQNQDHEATGAIETALIGAAVNIATGDTAAAAEPANPLLSIQMVHESQSPDFAAQVGQKGFRDEVKLEDTKITLFEVKGLTFMLRNSNSITKIKLKEVGFDLPSIEEISQFLSEDEKIKEASLIDSAIGGAAINELMKAVKTNKGLEKLELSFSRNIRDDSMKHVADALLLNEALKDLRLIGGNLRNEDISSTIQFLQKGHVCLRMYNHACEEGMAKLLDPFIQQGRLIFESRAQTTM